MRPLYAGEAVMFEEFNDKGHRVLQTGIILQYNSLKGLYQVRPLRWGTRAVGRKDRKVLREYLIASRTIFALSREAMEVVPLENCSEDLIDAMDRFMEKHESQSSIG